jgi:hypothetical protein
MTDENFIAKTNAQIEEKHAALHRDVRQLLLQARQKARHQIDTTVVQAYWGVGRRIVEDEQGGQKRAQYGAKVLQWLSGKLTQEFGSGYDVTNLRSMRRFYLAFPIRETLSPELGWSCYRLLSRIDNPQARDWYATEAAEQGWSVRALDRQIATLYYERLLSTQDQSKALVKTEAAQQIAKDAPPDPRDFIRDPYKRATTPPWASSFALSATPPWPSTRCWPTSPNSLPANTKPSCPPKPSCKPSWSVTVPCLK